MMRKIATDNGKRKQTTSGFKTYEEIKYIYRK